MSIGENMPKNAGVFLAMLLLATQAPAQAQDIAYSPINPSFGGSPFNSSHLLGIAGAQKPEKPRAAGSETTPSEQFLRQLQSRLLSALAGQVTDSIFGDNPQDHGTISFGNQLVTFDRGLDTVVLTVVDLAAGTTTEIEIPLLQSQ
jgi:curli production assembly/transport component CsgF